MTLATSDTEGTNRNVDQIYCQPHMLELSKDASWTTGGKGPHPSEDRGEMLVVETKPVCKI